MMRLTIASLAGALFALVPAGTATGQPFLRLGAADLDRVCPVAYNETYLVQPGPGAVSFSLPYCPPTKPLVVKRARRLTISLGYPGALKIGAAWFSGGERRTLFAQPVGGPPTQTWYIWLPMQSGSLLVHQWGLPTPSVVSGDLVQPRTDWKVAIQRGRDKREDVSR